MIITTSGQFGGLEKISYNLWQELKKNNNVKVLKIFKHEKFEVYNYGNDEIFIPGNNKLLEKNYLKKIYKLLKNSIYIYYYKYRYNIDVSLAMGEMCSILNGISCSNDYKIGSIHGKKAVYENKVNEIIAKKAFTNLNKIICVSQGIINDIELNFKNINKKKLELIYNPHNWDEIKRKSNVKLNEEESKIFSKKALIMVGRIDKNKGIAHALKILERENEILKEFNLVILGEIEKKEFEYEDIIKKYFLKENIYFLGFKDNPYKYIKNSFALLSCSYSEGLPNVIIESLIVNTPVISTNSSYGIWEILETNQKKINYDENLLTNYNANSGIITPTLKFDSVFEEKLSNEEKCIVEAIKELSLNYADYKKNLYKSLEKFELKNIISRYEKIMKLEKRK